MEKAAWKVEGMDCSNCALTISKYLTKQGMQEVKVNPIDGDVSFSFDEIIPEQKLKSGIEGLGYKVVSDGAIAATGKKAFLSDHRQRFLFCLIFTLPLMLHMLPWHIHWLMNPWVQLSLCTPVFIVGMAFFGRSAIKSIINGMPNMNVLIALGAVAAFAYSIAGWILNLGEGYLFFETTASVITLVFLGNYLEETSVQSTQRAVKKLARSQKVMANMIAFDDEHKENIFLLENTQLKVGDLILIKSGEQVPIDCKILWGDCTVNEAIITGESKPLTKQKKDLLIGGSVLENGTVKAQVTATGNETVLSGILHMVKQAQGEKPSMQKLADKISAVFVPAVIIIALITFLVNYFAFDISAGKSLMRSIAVLVISCPCAMGLATPAAIAVGLGRGARNGILYKNAAALERFKDIQQVVFDKTGTLTTGNFSIIKFDFNSVTEEEFKRIVYSAEKFSNHPVAKSVSNAWKINNAIQWKSIGEIKGMGMQATDTAGNIFSVGSSRLLKENNAAHSLYVLKNNIQIGWLDIADEIRPEAVAVINALHQKKIKTILLSGDKKENCLAVAAALGIDEIYAEQLPEQKLAMIAALNAAAPTAMIGDGINDAPALAKASLGISLSDASQIAMQSADVILLNHGIKNLPKALGLGRHTFLTIKENLFWAFIYNIIAIPVAAFGFLTPTFGALVMGFSDVVLAGNSLRLFIKKVD
ncbi:MAG: cation-translocating P-type ATPase [Ferruginibacter sp.]